MTDEQYLLEQERIADLADKLLAERQLGIWPRSGTGTTW